MIDALDDAALHEILNNDNAAFRFECGVSRPANSYKVDEKNTIIELMTLRSVILTRKAQLDQVAEGLSENGFLQFLQKDPSNAKKLFVCKKRHLTAETFKDLFTVGYSTPMVKKEQRTIENWFEFIQDVEGKGEMKCNTL